MTEAQDKTTDTAGKPVTELVAAGLSIVWVLAVGVMIMYLFDLYSGYDNEQKLRNALVALDLTPYEKKTGLGSGETILVLTEEYNRVLQGAPKR